MLRAKSIWWIASQQFYRYCVPYIKCCRTFWCRAENEMADIGGVWPLTHILPCKFLAHSDSELMDSSLLTGSLLSSPFSNFTWHLRFPLQFGRLILPDREAIAWRNMYAYIYIAHVCVNVNLLKMNPILVYIRISFENWLPFIHIQFAITLPAVFPTNSIASISRTIVIISIWCDWVWSLVLTISF